MSRAAPIAGIPLALAVVAGANPGKDKPKATVSAAEPAVTAPASQPAPEAIIYRIGPADSKIAWVGSKGTGKHDGGFTAFTGQAALSPGLETLKIDVTIDTDSLFSDDEKLTAHLKTPDFFNVQKFPKATFQTTAVARSAQGDTWDITGTLELIGARKTITFPATLALEGGLLKANAEFYILRKDFGMVYPGMPGDLIRDEVVIKLSIAARPGV